MVVMQGEVVSVHLRLHWLLLQPGPKKRGLAFAGRNGRTTPCIGGYQRCRAAHHTQGIVTAH